MGTEFRDIQIKVDTDLAAMECPACGHVGSIVMIEGQAKATAVCAMGADECEYMARVVKGE